MDLPIEMEFVGASSYGAGRVSSGTVEIAYGSWKSLQNREILVVEDVADSGTTLGAITRLARENGARGVRTVVLLSKPGADFVADYTGFHIDSRFVVGYGLDDNGRWRNLPYIGYVGEA